MLAYGADKGAGDFQGGIVARAEVEVVAQGVGVDLAIRRGIGPVVVIGHGIVGCDLEMAAVPHDVVIIVAPEGLA